MALSQRRSLLTAALHASLLLRSASAMATPKAAPDLVIRGAGEASINAAYAAQNPTQIPAGFARTCDAMGWSSAEMWEKLSDSSRVWFEAPNESYVYWNRADSKWWIDGPSGAGLYVAMTEKELPPKAGWVALPGAKGPVPKVEVVQ